MPLYELLCLSPPQVIQAKVVARQSIKAIMDNGGVVKNIEYLGTKDLPYRMKKHQIIHEKAAYWTIQFHSSPTTMSTLRKSLFMDQNVVRATFFKIGENLKDFNQLARINQL